MAVEAAPPLANAVSGNTAQVSAIRKNGKQWHQPRKPFRPTAGQTTYAKRVVKQAQEAEVKKMENEMKAEKEALRQVGFGMLVAKGNRND